MRRDREPGGAALRLALVAAVTVWVVMLSWRGLTANAADFLAPLLVVVLAVGVLGGGGRALGVPRTLVFLSQLFVAATLVLHAVVGTWRWSSTSVLHFAEVYRDALQSAANYAAPVPAQAAPVAVLFLVIGAVTALAVDLIALAWGQCAVAGLALLTVYVVPAAILPSSASWWVFVLGTAGFLTLLHGHSLLALHRWDQTTRTLAEHQQNFGVRTGAVAGTAATMGACAVVLAIAVPPWLPSRPTHLFGTSGPGGVSVTVKNPMVDLRRDLRRGDDLALVYVNGSADVRPDYLRISVLTSFNGEQWTAGDRTIPEANAANGALPSPPGVNPALPETATTYNLVASDYFDSTWLPTPALSAWVSAPGDWRFDDSTRDFTAAVRGLTTRNLSWAARGVVLDYDVERLDRPTSSGGTVAALYTSLPGELAPVVRTLATEVTADQPTKFRKARALQDWFRTEFTYSLDAVRQDLTTDQLADFLTTSRVGYCEQFAASMALMARALGIPARVAVGFLRPDRTDDSKAWVFSAWDLHAWPELYFPGSGWVRFEPTPGVRTARPPSYTRVPLAARNPLPSITSQPSAQALPTRSAAPKPKPTSANANGRARSTVFLATLGGLLLVGVAALLLLPRWLRQRRRRGRLTVGDIEDLWDELRDTATDLGHRWPEGRSPQQLGTWLEGVYADQGARDPAESRAASRAESRAESRAATGRLVDVLERERYSAAGQQPVDEVTRQAAAVCVQELADQAPTKARRLATWWPRTTWRRRP